MKKKAELYHASYSYAGHGHKRIVVELRYKGEYKSFQAITDDMDGFDKAIQHENINKKHIALFKLIEYKISDEINNWLNNEQ